MSVLAVSVVQGESSLNPDSPPYHPLVSSHLVSYPLPTAIIVLRICYVYSKNLLARAFIVGIFVACVISTAVLLGVVWHDIEAVPVNIPGIKITSCTAPPSKAVWKLFVPNIVLHTVLYLATTIPALRMRRLGKKSMLMDRLVMEYVTICGLRACVSDRGTQWRDILLRGLQCVPTPTLFCSSLTPPQSLPCFPPSVR